MIEVFSLDVETKGKEEANAQFALEPYRYLQGKAIITDLSVSGPDSYSKLLKYPTAGEISGMLDFLKGKIVYMHSAVFDTAWLYAYIQRVEPLADIDIRDTMLLAKWILNSQSETYKTKATRDEEGGYDLISLVLRFLPSNTPGLKEFEAMKKGEEIVAGQNPEYWEARAMMDTHFTRLLAIELQNRLPHIQRRGFLISQKQIPYTARAWVVGTPYDKEGVDKLIPLVTRGKTTLAKKIGVHESVLTSPSQLSSLLFNDWGLKPINFGKPHKTTGIAKGSTAVGDLKMIALTTIGTPIGEKMKLVMDFKKLSTLQTKYLNGFQRVEAYIGEARCHGAPKIFSTYTGRYTYSSKIKKKNDWQISIAMHQLPRKGPAKKQMIADEGRGVGKYDASGQEIAFMAWASKDRNMLSVLNQGMNVHSWMATNLNGMNYDELMGHLKAGDKIIYELRQAAKLLNLSCQYRIGWKALLAKFFETYDIIISQLESNKYLRIYKGAYPGVVQYWKDTCTEAQEQGYAETIARRRYYLSDWASHRWGTESSAINTPVQGSGADQKDLVIWQISKKFPEAHFALDIHDEGIFYLPIDHMEEMNKDIVYFLNGLDYEKFWDREVPMPLTFEGQIGTNFKDCEEYAQPWEDIQAMKK